MKYSEAKYGRVFVIRLEDGDILHECIEKFARENDVKAGFLMAVGGADKGSKLVVGPEEGRAENINPMEYILDEVHEITGTGTLFPDEKGEPKLHMHIACGRKDTTKTGCVRKGVKVWHILEIVLVELIDTEAKRIMDEKTGFELLKP
ncbi:MAG: DNA-binding protein [candidate division WOR-3 bacterium]